MTTDYDLRECTRVSQKIRVTLQSIAVDDAGGDSGDDLELYGDINSEGTSAHNMFHKDSGNYVQVHQGTQFGQPIAETVLDVNPTAGQAIKLHAHLFDQDTFSPDDDLGNETVVVPFETGWRKDVTVTLTGDSARVRVNFSIAPI